MYAAEAIHVCEFCFGRSRSLRPQGAARNNHPRDDRAGPLSMCATRPASRMASRRSTSEPGSRARARRPPGPRSSRRALGEGRHSQPTGSFKDRVVGVALTKPVSSGSACGVCVHRQPGELGRRARRRVGMESFVFVPHDLEEVKLIHRRLRWAPRRCRRQYDDVNRLCAELASEFASWLS